MKMDLMRELNQRALHHIVQRIFDYVDDATVVRAGEAAASWRRALDDAGVWRRLVCRNVGSNVVWQTLMHRMEHRAPQLFQRLVNVNVDVGDVACYRHVFAYLCDASEKLERNWRRGSYRKHVIHLNDAEDFVSVCRMDAEWIVIGMASGDMEIWHRWTLRLQKRIRLASGCVRDIRWHGSLMAVQFTYGGAVVLFDVDTESIITRIQPESAQEEEEEEALQLSLTGRAERKWGWELSRFSVGRCRLVAAVFISGQGQRIYQRDVTTRFVCYRLSACGAHVVKECQLVLSNQDAVRVEAVYCDADVIIICMSTPSGGMVQLRSANDAYRILRQHVLDPTGAVDPWRYMKNVHYRDGWILSRGFRICNIRPGVPDPINCEDVEMRVKSEKQMTALERHEMLKMLVSDRVQIVTSVTLRRCRRPTRNKLIVCDFLH